MFKGSRVSVTMASQILMSESDGEDLNTPLSINSPVGSYA